MKWLLLTFSLLLSISCSEPAPQPVSGSRVADAIAQSLAFRRGPAFGGLQTHGWLGVTPKAFPPAREWERDLLLHGFLVRKEGGWMAPDSKLAPRDFVQRAEWVYMVRCSEPRLLEVRTVTRSGADLVAKFRWRYLATSACSCLTEESIRRQLEMSYEAEATLEDRDGSLRVRLIPKFADQFDTRQRPNVFQ